jgi:hypothetical protein
MAWSIQEDIRSRRSDDSVWRRRSLGSAAAGKPCTDGFLGKCVLPVPGVYVDSLTYPTISLSSLNTHRKCMMGHGSGYRLANDMDGPNVLWGHAGRVRAYLQRRI